MKEPVKTYEYQRHVFGANHVFRDHLFLKKIKIPQIPLATNNEGTCENLRISTSCLRCKSCLRRSSIYANYAMTRWRITTRRNLYLQQRQSKPAFIWTISTSQSKLLNKQPLFSSNCKLLHNNMCLILKKVV